MNHIKAEHITDKRNTDFTGSVIDDNGHIAYYLNGEYHREDGPAVEYSDGGKSWLLNGKVHRIDGPAIERANGGKEWFLNGKRHRVDGPACEWSNGNKSWYYYDEFISRDPNYTLEDFQREIRLRLFK